MRKPFFRSLLASSALMLLIVSCASVRSKDQPAQVVRDCTGTYLRLSGKDYHVCNLDKVANFSDGQTIMASFKKIPDCHDKSQPEMTCMMFHENEGWIEVKKVHFISPDKYN